MGDVASEAGRQGPAERLAELEGVVRAGLDGFVAVGQALAEIRDHKLYRLAGHATFESYVAERFGLSRPHAYRVIEAAQVAEVLSPIGDKTGASDLSPVGGIDEAEVLPTGSIWKPSNEAQARELASLLDEPDELRAVAAQLADSELPVTAAAVREAVQRRIAQTAPGGTMPGTLVHAIRSGDYSDEWYTAAPVVEAARRVLGIIDLDPASSAAANAVVGAARFFTAADDGLSQEWAGRVWMNPPFSQVGAFVERLVAEYAAGHVPAAVALVAARTDTAWFQPLMAQPVCFLRGRRHFWKPDEDIGSPTFGCAVAYFGPDAAAFAAEFAALGAVMRPA